MHKGANILPFELSASILSADFARLGEAVEVVLEAGVDRIHFDVMDNHYVPNLTIGSMVCKSLRQYGIKAPIDVHLMVNPVERMIANFIEAGASTITFHPETSNNPLTHLNMIKQGGCQTGLAINPNDSIEHLKTYLPECNEVLIMSVQPGFGGQVFIPNVLEKIKKLEQHLIAEQLNTIIAIDGGINEKTIVPAQLAGAKRLVVGSAIFSGSVDHYPNNVALLKQLLSEGTL